MRTYADFGQINPSPSDFPWESRDHEVSAKVSYSLPMRRENQNLVKENLRLKRLLLENGIAWSPTAQAHIQQSNPTKRQTRASVKARQITELKLPMEVLLRIAEFAMTSSHPIIDPLSPTKRENLTGLEQSAGNKIAIHLLATCKSLQVEGQRFLWERNEFTFTSPEAVNQFAELDAAFRAKIQHVNFRIIAHFFDDERRRFRHKLDRIYHPDFQGKQLIGTAIRPKESPLSKGGFRSYTWLQVVDFLTGLRAPYDPKFREKTPRPRLLPSLVSLRLDLVNFAEMMLPMPTKELHDVANHELARTLNELQLTGLPCDEVGMKAASELIGMVKDNGLYLESVPKFASPPNKARLQLLPERTWCGRVIRPLSSAGADSDTDGPPSHDAIGQMPAAPKDAGYPETTEEENERFLFKRIPVSRDSTDRVWTRFSSKSGYLWARDSEYDSEDEEFLDYCPNCGESHPGSSFVDHDDYGDF